VEYQRPPRTLAEDATVFLLSPLASGMGYGMWCVIFAGAPVRATDGLKARLRGAARVVAADGGARTALACGLVPDLVVGDLDSIDAPTLARLDELGVPREVYPTDKEATDGDLALQRACAWGAERITIVGALGGPRLDHELANILLLTRPELAGRRLNLLGDRQEVMLLRGGERLAWTASPGEIVSLLPLGGPAEGVTTAGLRWPLRAERLDTGSTRGVSNEAEIAAVSVSLARGCLLVVRALAAGQRDWAESAHDGGDTA
jgi:thiamine pyrophosphokinase